MGREVRKVPANWQHPKDEHGHLIPMHEEFPYNDEEIAEGLADGWLRGLPPHYNIAVMPSWPEAERTHLMMYENTSEGTPISPAFRTPEELARWLTDNCASAFGDATATYEAWLATCRRGSAPSMIISSETGLVSGVEASAPKRTDG